VNHKTRYLSIFGGKLTDCLNVGNEIAEHIAQLGIQVPQSDAKWYGESSRQVKTKFMQHAKLINLDALTPASSSEPLSQRLWRRYDTNAFAMLTAIEQQPEKAKLLINNAEYLVVEVEHAAEHEMITKLDDFLRRRSKISMVVRKSDILSDPGLRAACQILFGDEAEEKLKEYQAVP
jgi:alpha-glycerophosphate oxidase/glycerol-3-phosphate dehydrogenase